MSSPKAQHEKPTSGGIYDGFESYRVPSRKEYISVLREGLVVLDTNILLDLYRFEKQSREELLSAFRAIGDRLWVPHHVMAEFWRNRETVLKDPGGTGELVTNLQSIEKSASSALAQWGNRRSHPAKITEELSDSVAEVFDRIITQVARLSREAPELWARDTSLDAVLQELSTILDGKVGPALSEEAYKAALVEAKRRGEEQIPPGYKDAKKPEPQFAGDYLVWEQLLLEAAVRATDVLFITRDAKEDWVRIEGGETRSPRIELQDELRRRTGRQFYLRTPAQLLELAQESLAVNVSTESVEDATRISDQLDGADLGWKAIPLDAFVDYEVEKAPRWDVESATRFLVELGWLDRVAGDATKLAVLTGGTIGHEILVRLGIIPEPLILRQIAAAIEEQGKRMVQRGEAPVEALNMIEPVRKKQPKGDSVLVGYKIRKDFLFDLLQAVKEPDTHLNSSSAVMVELNEFLKRLMRLEWDTDNDASES